MRFLRFSCATKRSSIQRTVGLPADRRAIQGPDKNLSNTTNKCRQAHKPRSCHALGGAAKITIFLLATFLLAAGPASAETPCTTCKAWWHLTSGVRPAVLQAGVARDEVQEVSAVEGALFVLKVTNEKKEVVEFFFESAPYSFGFVAHATAGNVQSALETVYGAGNVAVTGQGAEGLPPLKITSTGGDVSRFVPPVEVTGLVGEASATLVTAGRPDGEVVLTATDLGDATVDAHTVPVVVADGLPAGLTAVSIEAVAGESQKNAFALMGCTLSSWSCSFEGAVLPPFWPIEVVIGVDVTGPVAAANQGSVSGGETLGGGAIPAVASAPRAVTVAGGPPEFGVENYELVNENEGGMPDTQAGSHPFQQTTTITLNQTLGRHGGEALHAPSEAVGLQPQPVELPRDTRFRWPAGLVGNPSVMPHCTAAEISTSLCPADTAVGAAMVEFSTIHLDGRSNSVVPVFNMEPNIGEPARFAFRIAGTVVFIDASVRTGGDYGVTVKAERISQEITFLSSQVTIWGVPGKPEHDISRGWGCLEAAEGNPHPLEGCVPAALPHPPAFLSMPTSCTGSLNSDVEADSWIAPTAPGEGSRLAAAPMPALDGCNRLPFEPSVKVTPDGSAGSTPTGLNVDVHVPQEETLNANGLAESDPRGITVALPSGVAVNPSGGDGLEGCSEALAGFTGEVEVEPGVHAAGFTPRLPGSIPALEAGEGSALQPGGNFCQDASKIGEVSIRTPILPNPVKGFVYLASQNQNPFGSLVAIYIVAEDPVSGVTIKLAGQVHLTDSGQLVTTFENSPQAPFEDAEFKFFGGERAPLASPARCATYTTTASFLPWSAQPGEAPRSAESHFQVTSGPHGAACPGASLPFSPTLTGGTTNIQAAAFSPLSTTIARPDGQQNMQSVQLHMPPGLSGLLSGVELCQEPQANQGLCGEGSKIGETTVAAGVGSDPVSVKGGKVFITGPYNGSGGCTVGAAGCAPFGLSIVNPVKAGPFDLEHDTSNPAQNPACDCVVVRAKIEIDPATAALTITTDPAGVHAIPQLIDGVPVQIQKVNVLINRQSFTFNPTNCTPASMTGAITGDEGGSSPVSVPFQATNCAILQFTPKLTVSTSGKTSKSLGASLTATVSEPANSMGTQANISLVKVELPKQLPSRLTTLQKACLAAVFNVNPANCPSASVIGHAKVITPLLPVPLEGPAIFVSHGGEAFPSLTMVLQGYGVTVHLVGTTFIDKHGITSTTFKSVPDTPFNTFSLTLPEGKFSALAANGSLCGQTLKMPNEFVGQNGLKVTQSTAIKITGCKPAIRVVKHSVKGTTATIIVSVPSAGKLVATGSGLSKASKSSKGAGTLSVKLTLSNGEAAFLGKHKGRKLKATIHLSFIPKKGSKLKTSVNVLVG
jgi:hypothetical protein